MRACERVHKSLLWEAEGEIRGERKGGFGENLRVGGGGGICRRCAGGGKVPVSAPQAHECHWTAESCRTLI